MRFLKIIGIFALTLLFSSGLLAQEMPDGFAYDKRGKLVFQIGPQEEFAARAAAREGGFFALALAAGMIENQYYLTLYNAVPQNGDYIFEKQKELPATLTVDGEKISLGKNRNVFSKKVGKIKVEIMLIEIAMDDFEKLVAAAKVHLEFGRIDHLASAENLRAFHYLSAKMEADEDLGPDGGPSSAGTGGSSTPSTIHVRGYYRKDGTYVRAHTRKRPTN